MAGVADTNRRFLQEAEDGNAEGMRECLGAGADIAAIDDLCGDTTALVLAAYHGHIECVRILLEYEHFRDDPESANHVLVAASIGGSQELLNWAIERGANNFNQGLQHAVENGHVDLAHLFIDEYGADDFNGGLRSAARGGHDGLLRLFRDRYGADDFVGAAEEAISCDQANILQLLIKECALDVHELVFVERGLREKPLFWAVTTAAPKCMQILLENGASVVDLINDSYSYSDGDNKAVSRVLTAVPSAAAAEVVTLQNMAISVLICGFGVGHDFSVESRWEGMTEFFIEIARKCQESSISLPLFGCSSVPVALAEVSSSEEDVAALGAKWPSKLKDSEFTQLLVCEMVADAPKRIAPLVVLAAAALAGESRTLAAGKRIFANPDANIFRYCLVAKQAKEFAESLLLPEPSEPRLG